MGRERPPRILAIGTASPARDTAQGDAVAILERAHRGDPETARKLRALARHSRIERRQACTSAPGHPLQRLEAEGARADPASSPSTARRMEAYAALAPHLLAEACCAALAQPGAPPREEVTWVIAASCTGFLAPGLDVHLVRELGLRKAVGRTLVGFQGCQAGLTALRVADAACRADPRALVLVACVELCTLHVQETTREDDLVAATLFGDGASAALVGGSAREGAGPGYDVLACATGLIDDSLDHMAWSIGDRGFALRLSAYVPKLLASDVRPFLVDALGLEPGEAQRTFWAVHPGGAAILDGLERSLELAPSALDASRTVLARHGNMSSPTVWFVLSELLRRGTTGPGIALAFGPGLTVEAVRLVAR